MKIIQMGTSISLIRTIRIIENSIIGMGEYNDSVSCPFLFSYIWSIVNALNF